MKFDGVCCFVIFELAGLLQAKEICDSRSDGTVCCEGFILNVTTGNCTECEPGFYGTNCSKICKYPTFGEKCSGHCSCQRELCHYMTGCLSLECKPGFYGTNCSKICQYPTFGKKCSGHCSCQRELCHYMTGCLSLASLLQAKDTCGSLSDGTVCCEGFILNVTTGNCTECEPGFYGTNCSKICQYPTFGEKCSGCCSCQRELCHHMTGCPSLDSRLESPLYSEKSNVLIPLLCINVLLLMKEVLILSVKLFLWIKRNHFTRMSCTSTREGYGWCEKISFAEPTCVEIQYDVEEERLSFQFYAEPRRNGKDIDESRTVDSDQNTSRTPHEEMEDRSHRDSIYSLANPNLYDLP